jgi:hypothetical protein
MDAIHRVDGDRVHVSPNAAGPWDGGMQHGSAPAALAVWAAESIPAKEAMRIARVTIDLMRPVPLAPLTLQTEVLRRRPRQHRRGARFPCLDLLHANRYPSPDQVRGHASLENALA